MVFEQIVGATCCSATAGICAGVGSDAGVGGFAVGFAMLDFIVAPGKKEEGYKT